MGKRIRHLEFYGFPDQNVFNGAMNIDLTDIRETNRDQDREIGELSGQTKNKADMCIVMELSGKVDTFIDSQSAVNEEVSQTFSGMTDKINEIADIANANEDAISSLTESFESHVNEFNTFSADTESSLAGKLGKAEAEEVYAKKSDVYLRNEADETFLKEHQDISHLALKSDLEALQSEVESLDDKYATDEELNALETRVDVLVEGEISAITAIGEEIEEIKGNISGINASVETINETLDGIETELDKKTDYTTFVSTIEDIDNEIGAMDAKKADKSDLNVLSGNVESLGAALGRETLDRQSGDAELSGRIISVKNDVNDLANSLSDVNNSIEDLRHDLEQEVQDRKAADAALVGTEGGGSAADTIWGAKEYANTQRNVAVSQSNAYTDEKLSGIDTLIDNKLEEFDAKISGKADKTYVDGLVADRVSGAVNELNDKIDTEVQTLKTKDENIETEIEDLRNLIGSGNTKDIYKRINIITTYSGETADEYKDDGNGILDVLHREFHQLEDEIGVVANPTLVKTNEYEVSFGRYNASSTGSEPSERTMFSIGNGTGNYDRKNAFEIRENGDVYMWIENEFMPINNLLAMLAHEMY